MSLVVTIVCAICSKPSPSGGCDRPDCTWRAEAFADAVKSGALVHTRCDASNNSAEDIAEGRLNFSFTAYQGTAGNA